MAEIATFRCDNYRCRMTLRMCKDFPVWRAETPANTRQRLSTSSANANFIIRYRTELYCRTCRFLIADPMDATCPRCRATELFDDQTGLPCVQCAQGRFVLAHLSVR